MLDTPIAIRENDEYSIPCPLDEEDIFKMAHENHPELRLQRDVN